ncbi:MAG: 50S ribosomal protein L9 [Simkania negevensis]|nr:50S ribosomal protein L9 [Simkania negevensis]
MQKTTKSKNQLLLLEDVRNVGRKGDLVSAKPGFARNFLLPQKKAVLADKRTLRMQEQLKEERAKQAALDKKDAEGFATRLKGKILTLHVKTDNTGHLFGSVSAVDIVKVLAEQEGIEIERRSVLLNKAIKTVGTYEISLRLKEGVPASFQLKIIGEGLIEMPPQFAEVIEEEEARETDLFTEEIGQEIESKTEKTQAEKEELEERSKG